MRQARDPSVVNFGARLDDAHSPCIQDHHWREGKCSRGARVSASKMGTRATTFCRLRKRQHHHAAICTRRGRNMQVSVTMRRIRTCSTGKDSGEGETEQAEVKCRALLGAVQRQKQESSITTAARQFSVATAVSVPVRSSVCSLARMEPRVLSFYLGVAPTFRERAMQPPREGDDTEDR